MLLADLVLLVHFAFVLFVVLGLPAIWIGAALGWRWVRNFWFRLAHLGAILFVAAESLIGVACPLTEWEDALRQGSPGGTSFMQRWVQRLLYYDLPEWVFTTAYAIFAAAVAATFWRIRPESPFHRRRR
ncbi:MAG: DUF2784 domain-containing protein [Pseudomonadota bacterium]